MLHAERRPLSVMVTLCHLPLEGEARGAADIVRRAIFIGCESMRNAWLVYCAEDAKRNKESIAMFRSAMEKQGIRMRLVIYEDLFPYFFENQAEKLYAKPISEEQAGSLPDIVVSEGLVGGFSDLSISEGRERNRPDFAISEGRVEYLPDIVINRTRSYAFAVWLERHVLHVFNTSKVTLLGNDKVKALAFARERGVRTLQVFTSPETIPGWPVVAKTLDGHGGKEVYLVSSLEEAVTLKERYKNLFFQEYSRQGNCDLRVYVVGGEPYCAIKRQSEKDFRSNYSLGGSAEAVSIPDDVAAMTGRLLQGLGEVGYCGIDFIRDEDGWVFNEIEDVVGARTVYACTDLKPIEAFVKYIASMVAR